MTPLNPDPTDCVIERLSPVIPAAKRRVAGHFHGFAHQQLLVTTHHPGVLAGAATVEYEDVLFIGEVVACTPAGEGIWTIRMQVHQLLNGLQSLTILRERLLWSAGSSRLQPLTDHCVLA